MNQEWSKKEKNNQKLLNINQEQHCRDIEKIVGYICFNLLGLLSLITENNILKERKGGGFQY